MQASRLPIMAGRIGWKMKIWVHKPIHDATDYECAFLWVFSLPQPKNLGIGLADLSPHLYRFFATKSEVQHVLYLQYPLPCCKTPHCQQSQKGQTIDALSAVPPKTGTCTSIHVCHGWIQKKPLSGSDCRSTLIPQCSVLASLEPRQ